MNIRISDHAKQHMPSCSITEQEVRDLFDEKNPGSEGLPVKRI